ncbi:hypothetical protein AVEN_51691-1 [Araneus ventricosus]|uniref:Mos1 transposase HTH domain-containing protein n=1 Tax=Araneus ventricosus TaxID=182803 RepID=A0A4Y2HSA0_ARAVE|nr:hypothetical protein AVEN_51691-1 [Araneus ventricosus]
MLAVTRFVWAKQCNCTEMYRKLHEVYGENAMPHQAIAVRCEMSENGRTDIDNAKREGRPSTATNSEIAACVKEIILANGRVAVEEIANKLDISHGSMQITVKHLEFNNPTYWLLQVGRNSSQGTVKLMPRLNKCLNKGSKYI